MIKKRTLTIILVYAALSAGVLLLVSCPPQINDDLLKQVKDELGPAITINSPEDGDSYAATVVVSGKVEDKTTDEGDKGEVQSLSFEVKATDIGDAVDFNDKGKFSFSFETKGLSGSLTITVTAEDKNGNSTEASITLEDAGAIPSFSAKPGNHKVKLSWDDVPLADSYTLYYTTNGTMPSENYGSKIDNVTSPYQFTGLENGAMHVFKLKANSSEGEDNWSHVEYAIPLSERTLAPKVYEEYGQIELVWNAIPATDEFEVYRSTSYNGNYINISGSVRANSFTDTTVKINQNYFYKISPALSGSSQSAACFGRADPFHSTYPVLCGGYDTPLYATKVDVRGNYLYIADMSSGLHVLDISTPDSPIYRDGEPPISSDILFDVDVTSTPAGTFAYTASFNRGITYYFVGNPYSISLVGSASYHMGPDQTMRIEIDNGKIYAADNTNGLVVFDILTSGAPYSLNTYPSGNAPGYDVAVSGNYAYCAFGSSGLYVVNVNGVSRATAPTLEGIYTANDSIKTVAVSGSYAYVIDNNQFVAIDVSTPTGPTEAGSCTLSVEAEDLTISGNYAYVAGEGIHIIDISDPTTPILIGSQNTSGDSMGVAINDTADYAYIADGTPGLKIFDLSQPSSPALGNSISTPSLASGITIAGGYAYTATQTGLQVIDISNPTGLTPKDHCDTVSIANKVAVCGNHAFTAVGVSGLQIIDISNPDSLTAGAVCDTTSNALDVALSGDFAVVADYDSGIKIIDISDIDAPQIISSHNTPGKAYGVYVYGDYAFIADEEKGLRILDISDPSLPISTGSIDPPSSSLRARSVAVKGDYAYVGYRSAAPTTTDPVLQAVDISDPSAPVETGIAVASDDVSGIAIRGIYAYAATADNGGFDMFSLANPASPVSIGDCATSGIAGSIAVAGGYAFIADGLTGLQAVELDP